MKRWIFHYRAVIGYVFIVLIASLALELHAKSVESTLDKRDQTSCMQRRTLARNQLDNLHALIADISQASEDNKAARSYVSKLLIDSDDLVRLISRGC